MRTLALLLGDSAKMPVRPPSGFSLVKRCEEVWRETVCRMRVGEREGVRFWTGKRLKQGYPLSPGLFTILLADLDKVLGREG